MRVMFMGWMGMGCVMHRAPLNPDAAGPHEDAGELFVTSRGQCGGFVTLRFRLSPALGARPRFFEGYFPAIGKLSQDNPPPVVYEIRLRKPLMATVDKPLQRVLSGFIRMHVLHHAEKGDLFGHWMIEELRHHGYSISAGTLYPMLRAMERDGWIEGRDEEGGARRRLYRITREGRAALKEARARLQELFTEVGDSSGKKGRP
jgi:PadR family transcriptional regulator, regulatory protein PadR